METKPFKLKYGPHFGMFKNHAGDDPVDQLKFAADEGFTAWEDNGMRGRSVADQERIAKAMTDLGMHMGVFVANTIGWTDPSLTTGNAEHLDRFVADCKDSVEVAKRVNAKWMTVVPGTVQPRMGHGLPDLERDRGVASWGGDFRAARIGDGARTAQFSRSPELVPDEDGPGVRDLPRCQQPVVQDPRRSLPPADHRGQPHPQHR